ncbi:MAG TPA: type IV secretion system DNA-binding domain-containing protein [Candidatus Binatia bacterium]|nr:type IV secretion system DNA-binding domain-containing protein [Candidatus Binatia bacterium]
MGRAEHLGRGWPTRWPVSSLGALVLAVVAGIGIFTIQNGWYWGQYLNTEVFPTRASSPHGNYRLLAKVDRHGQQRMAVDADVVPTRQQGRQLIPFVLSQQARQAGATDLVVDTVRYTSQQMHQMLAEWVYDHQSPDDLIRPAWIGALGVFVLGLVLAIPPDRARLHMLEHGRRLKGPQMVTVKEFNRWSRADGIGFVTTERKQMLSIPRSFESSHVMVMGDSGTGKSALLRQVLMQIAELGETAIVYDPALEYTPQFYQPSRGDLILNPLDARCPYWSPSDEVMHEAEALTLATSLFPDKPRDEADRHRDLGGPYDLKGAARPPVGTAVHSWCTLACK